MLNKAIVDMLAGPHISGKSRIDMQVYLLDKEDYFSAYMLQIKHSPLVTHKPSLLAIIRPLTAQVNNASLLFDHSGHILAVNALSAEKFGITLDLVQKSRRSGLLVYDLFLGLKDCISNVSKSKRLTY